MATVNTTWTSPASATLDKATGAVIDEAMTDAWSSNFYNLGGTVGFIGCRALLSGAQSVNNTTDTAILFNAESFDSDPNGLMHDNVTLSSRITIRTSGTYNLSGVAEFAANSTSTRRALIRLNGSTILAGDSKIACAEGGQTTYTTVATSYALVVTDYIELFVYQASGGALNVSTASLSCVKA